MRGAAFDAVKVQSALAGNRKLTQRTTAAQFIIQTWSKKAIKAREEKLVFAINSNRVYENDADLGATINIPNRSHLTAQSKDRSNNAAITFETVSSQAPCYWAA